VITGFFPPAVEPETDRKRTASASEAYRETILLELSRGHNAMGIFQLWREWHSWKNAEFSTMPSRGHLARSFVFQPLLHWTFLWGPVK
jgi:hypothetical protein